MEIRGINPFHIELNWFRGPAETRCPRDGPLLVDYVSLVSSQASLRPWCHTWKLKTMLPCRSGGITYYTLILQIPGPARNQFWYDVIKESLSILKESDLQETWWKEETRTNANIKKELTDILKPAMTAFFDHPITKACLSETGKPDLPFLLIIDEAAYLYQTNYLHSFMWVLDEPVVSILRNLASTLVLRQTNFLYSCLALILKFLILRQIIYIHPNDSSTESSRFHLCSLVWIGTVGSIYPND